MGSEQQFCLRWNNHQSNLLSVFDNLLQNETLVDVTLACEGLSLKAHKVVLSACSPYFQHLFMDNPCKHPIVILKDIGYTDMKTLIDFMYKGEVNVSHDQLSTLLRVADTLKVKGLAEVTENMAARECDPVSRRQTESSVPEATHKPSFSRVGKSTGNLSPPPKRRKKRRSSGGSVGHSDDVDSHGPKDASSRSSTPVEIPIVPKSEVLDISYDGPEKPLCSVTEDSLPLMNASNSSQHVSMAHEAAIMPHPLTSKDSTEVSQKFELPGEELETDMPFTQHLAVGSDGTPPSPGAHPSTSSSSHVDQSSYFPPSSSLNLANVASASCPSTSRSASTQAQQRMLRINTKERSSAKNMPLMYMVSDCWHTDDTSQIKESAEDLKFQGDDEMAIPQVYDSNEDINEESSSRSSQNLVQEGEVLDFGEELRRNKVTKNFPLPNFSALVERELIIEQQPFIVWKKMIEQAANFYLENFPNIRDQSDYRAIGERLIEKYPCLAMPGKHPWTRFTKSLSHKMRNMRWMIKKKSQV